MSLKDVISDEIKAAMKAKDKVRLETVRSIKKVILEREVIARERGKDGLTPDEEVDILTQQAKQRRDSIEQYRNAGREELADKEAQELAVIETFLPQQLSDTELETAIGKIVAQVGATSPKDMGKVMGAAMKELKGQADGKKVQEITKRMLSR